MTTKRKVEVVFGKFLSIYGAQKVASMWAGADIEEVKGDWARQIERFGGQAIGNALQSLVDQGSAWPPSMGEFVLLCKQHTVAPEHRLALPLPKKTDAELADGKRRVAEMLAALADKKRVRA